MKKLFLALVFVITVVILAHAGKRSEPKKDIEKSVKKSTVHNFLSGNLYHYSSYYDEQKQLKTFLNLTKDGLNEAELSAYEHYIYFPDSLHYQIYNSALCGSGCSFQTFGKYYLHTEEELVMILDSIKYYRGCGNMPTIYGNRVKKISEIIRTKNDSTIQILEPIDNKLSNKQ